MHPDTIIKELRKALDAILGALAGPTPPPVPIRIKAGHRPPHRL